MATPWPMEADPRRRGSAGAPSARWSEDLPPADLSQDRERVQLLARGLAEAVAGPTDEDGAGARHQVPAGAPLPLLVLAARDGAAVRPLRRPVVGDAAEVHRQLAAAAQVPRQDV